MSDTDYSPGQLRAMDDEEARSTLTVDQYERREKLLEMEAEANETAERFAEEEETVHGISVATDPEELGTTVETMGNTLLVHLDRENRHVRQHLQALDEQTDEGDDVPDPGELDDETADEAIGHVFGLFKHTIIRWNGDDFATLDETEKDDILHAARRKWGDGGIMLALFDVFMAVAEEHEEREQAMESFRGATGRDGNRSPR